MKTLDRKLGRDLVSLRASVLTLAGLVACGVGLLVATWSAYRSLQSTRDRYYAEYVFADLFVDLKKAPLRKAARVREIPGVAAVEPRIVFDGLVETAKSREPAVGRFISTSLRPGEGMNRLFLRRGRWPQAGHVTDVLVHEGFALAHELQPGDSFTATLRGQRMKLRVAGVALSPEYVFALGPAAPLPDDLHFGVFWVRRELLESLGDMRDSFNSLLIRTGRGANVQDIKERVNRELHEAGGRSVYGRDLQQSSSFLNDEIRQQRVSAMITPAIFLGIAAFLIHIVIGRLIAMQRSQVAVLKALGYGGGEIFGHYVKLVTVIALTGTVPGLLIGAWLGQVMSKMYESFFRFPSLEFSLNATSIGLGIGAGLIPAFLGTVSALRSIATLPPAEAMRPPSPPTYGASLIERWAALRRLRTRGRMTVRELALRPLRLFLTVTGLALAAAVVIAGGFWTDVIEDLMVTQFQEVQREDLTATLLRPVPASGLLDFARLKGVYEWEGARTLPVRVSWRQYRKDMSLSGWPLESRLRRPLDADRRPIAMPMSGVLLSRRFEADWGLKPGDEIVVESLEGHARQPRLRVAGFSDDLMGSSASMRIERLWDVFDEEPGYNMVLLRVEPEEASRLMVRLQEYPQVGSLQLKRTVEEGFQRSTGDLMGLTTMILMLFSLGIASGIVFNSVRVGFSEKSWEMASLMVLGFRRSEVFSLLFLQIAVQVGLALLPGLLFGTWLAHQSINLVNTETFNFPVIISPKTYALSVLVVLGSLAVSLLVISRSLRRLDMVEALKARD